MFPGLHLLEATYDGTEEPRRIVPTSALPEFLITEKILTVPARIS